jgi:hypothetical protein
VCHHGGLRRLGEANGLEDNHEAEHDKDPHHLHGQPARSPGPDVSIVFECDAETQQGIKARLEANRHRVRVTDHGYCVSLYVTDPNQLRLECTVDHPAAARIYADQRMHAHESLQRWLAGGPTPNHDFRPH